MASLQPLEETLGLRKAKHLLRRATFNYTKSTLNNFANMTVQDAVSNLTFNPAYKINEPYDPLPTSNPDGYWISSGLHPNTFDGAGRKRSHVTAWWWFNALNEVSLKYKLSFFLHTCFTAAKDNGAGLADFYFDHLRLLDFYALGNIKTLAKKITLDNGMLDYLDNTQNNKNNPNENYAREYLELFTILKGKQIGEGNYTNYTEYDIQQAAKVFSGFKKKFDRAGDIDPETNIPIGYISTNQHDTNNKTFSSAFGGQTIVGRSTAPGILQELHDFVEMVFAQPETAKAYCRRLYRYFVKSSWSEEVENDIIAPLAQLLVDNNYDILPVVTTLLSSKHFYDEDDTNNTDNTIGAIIKGPLQLVCEVCSFFEVPLPDPTNDALRYYRDFFFFYLHNTYFKATGMEFFNPDSVAGYPAYYQEPSFDRLWFSSNTLIGRYMLIENLILGKNNVDNKNIHAKLDTVVFIENTLDASIASNPNTLVETLAELLYPERIDSERILYFKTFLIEDSNDYYWSGAWNQYLNTKSASDKNTVKVRLDALVIQMVNAPEFQLM